MRNKLTRAAGAVVILAGLTVATATEADAQPVPAGTMPACLEDDGSAPAGAPRCVWDARHMGNGLGHSYVSIQREHGDPRIRYVSHHRAHRLAFGGAR